ncbi:MAG TPA: ABC transporter ATP-binding protein [Verrucomicrobiae bacterium]|nr:ABC transporter ATP-binding protein [Verrucomicrobiae bacterium]
MNARAGATIAFDSLVVTYPGADRAAIDGVSFDVPAGSFTVVLGPSGCGKSTLLRSVNRLVEASTGRVLLDGGDVSGGDAVALRRGIGYVIQAVGLFSHMTVAQNIAVVPGLLDWEQARIDARVDELLSLVGLEPQRYRARYPRALSGGEAQRVGVARAIAAQPRVLLMDEPFGAVDAIVRASLQDETRRIASELRTTILFVTHDVDEALRLADRIVVMRDGRVEQAGTPLELLTAPATPYVASLFGTGTAIAAEASLRDVLAAFSDGAQRLTVRDGDNVGTISFAALRQARGDNDLS